ncbi:MAG: insulinase family protein, partial [Firmicutes bacterium]|nr:insulinase family protein [Bacillota bacterium]
MMGKETGWFCYPTKRFKTITMQAVWVNELTRGERALGAVLPQVLRRGTTTWENGLAIDRRLEEMYGASFRVDVGKIADKQLITFHLEVIDGQYLPGHPDTLGWALDFLGDVMQKPRRDSQGHFIAEWVNQEKELVRRRIEALINDKAQYAAQRLLEEVAAGRRFGLRKWGDGEELAAIDAARLTDYFHAVLTDRPLLFV